jgi:hypothetical protein
MLDDEQNIWKRNKETNGREILWSCGSFQTLIKKKENVGVGVCVRARAVGVG